MKLQAFQSVREIADESDLKASLLRDRDGVFGAFWLIAEAPVMALFINGEQACLFYTPLDGADLTSFSDACVDPQATVPFLIENHQRDAMPADIVIPRRLAEEAFVEFYRSRRLHSGVAWR